MGGARALRGAVEMEKRRGTKEGRRERSQDPKGLK